MDTPASGLPFRVLALLFSSVAANGCAPTGSQVLSDCGFATGCGDLEAHPQRRRTLQQRRDAPSPSPVKLDEGWVMDSDARTHHLDFIRERAARLEEAQESEDDKRWSSTAAISSCGFAPPSTQMGRLVSASP